MRRRQVRPVTGLTLERPLLIHQTRPDRRNTRPLDPRQARRVGTDQSVAVMSRIGGGGTRGGRRRNIEPDGTATCSKSMPHMPHMLHMLHMLLSRAVLYVVCSAPCPCSVFRVPLCRAPCLSRALSSRRVCMRSGLVEERPDGGSGALMVSKCIVRRRASRVALARCAGVENVWPLCFSVTCSSQPTKAWLGPSFKVITVGNLALLGRRWRSEKNDATATGEPPSQP